MVVIPLACASCCPILSLLDRATPLGSPETLHWVTPTVGFFFLAFCLQLWKLGVRRYHSTGL